LRAKYLTWKISCIKIINRIIIRVWTWWLIICKPPSPDPDYFLLFILIFLIKDISHVKYFAFNLNYFSFILNRYVTIMDSKKLYSAIDHVINMNYDSKYSILGVIFWMYKTENVTNNYFASWSEKFSKGQQMYAVL
jgi:hypothetical protein